MKNVHHRYKQRPILGVAGAFGNDKPLPRGNLAQAVAVGSRVMSRLSYFLNADLEKLTYVRPCNVVAVWRLEGRAVGCELMAQSRVDRFRPAHVTNLDVPHEKPGPNILDCKSLFATPNAQPYIWHDVRGENPGVPPALWPEIAARRAHALLFMRTQAGCVVNRQDADVFHQQGLTREGFVFPIDRADRNDVWYPDIGDEARAPRVSGLTAQHIHNIVAYVYDLGRHAETAPIPPLGAWPKKILQGWVHAPRAGQNRDLERPAVNM